MKTVHRNSVHTRSRTLDSQEPHTGIELDVLGRTQGQGHPRRGRRSATTGSRGPRHAAPRGLPGEGAGPRGRVLCGTTRTTLASDKTSEVKSRRVMARGHERGRGHEGGVWPEQQGVVSGTDTPHPGWPPGYWTGESARMTRTRTDRDGQPRETRHADRIRVGVLTAMSQFSFTERHHGRKVGKNTQDLSVIS